MWGKTSVAIGFHRSWLTTSPDEPDPIPTGVIPASPATSQPFASATLRFSNTPPTALTTTPSPAPALPPFRSTTTFPRAPKPEQLPALYASCLQALQEANTARHLLRERMEAKKRVIAAIRLEMDRLEQDVVLEAGTRARLHAMNLRLVEALQEMESLVGNLDALVHEAHRVPRTRLGGLINTLKALVTQWQTFKRRLQEALARDDRPGQDGTRS